MMGEAYIEQMTASVPLGTLDDTEDVANAMLFFAFDEAQLPTGQTPPESAIALEAGQ